jgi:Mg2+ and Co2+ transporter CorA
MATTRAPVAAWLYDANGEDSAVDDIGALDRLNAKQTLWVDLHSDQVEGARESLLALGIDIEPDDAPTTPKLVRHEHMIEVAIEAVGDALRLEPEMLHCFIGLNWMVTIHDGDLDLVNEFNAPLNGGTRLGELSGPKFLSILIDWVLTGYFGAIEQVHAAVDLLDEHLLQTGEDDHDPLPRLLDLRRQVRKLRRHLAGHRDVLSLLSHPESGAVVGEQATEDFQRNEQRLGQALDEVEVAREMIVGSFDIHMTRTAETTNDIMKRLTIISVLLLPAAVIAGIMGMNFKVGFFANTWMFWVVIAGMIALAGVSLALARRRKWF